ncbi:MAG TPA: laminin G [Cytophagales bacterium]|nr:laminin G [Cytophagales bacterium]
MYLNGYSSASGSDWWYDLMPNVFFYQLYSLYPTTTDYNSQLTLVADRWLSAVDAMGGSVTPWTVPQMNYRGFNFATMTPNASSVTEPEAAGTIAWLLYHAYEKTGNKKYLEGAKLSISFLSNLSFNPAYEIQLPYGTFIAAKMNAELGTNYNIQKMLNWSFDQSSKRNWGTVVGTWGNNVTGLNDVSGLVGEIDNPSTGYAFTMNGFQQASALVPVMKYDKRFARTIAKWTLNLANASRLFYSKYRPSSHQDGYAWSSVNDPHAVIAYEALKQTGLNDTLLFATGDALRNGWAQTNFGLYGSSHVGYLGSILQTTDVDAILLLDLNKTDFFGKNPFPSYAVYNPYGSSKTVTLPLGTNAYDIYDAISETIIKTGATGNSSITVPGNQVLLLVYLPSGSSTVASNGKLVVGDKIVDYHYGYDFTSQLLIQSLASKDSLVEYNQPVKIYSSVLNKKGPLTFTWYMNGIVASTTTDSTYTWITPSTSGQYKLLLSVTDGVSVAKDSLVFSVVAHIPVPPVISSITTDSLWYYTDSTATVICHVNATDKTSLKYSWSVPGGSIVLKQDSILKWKVPSLDALYTVACTVKNADSLSATVNHLLLVKTKTQLVQQPVAYYPMNGDVKDASGNNHNATASGVQLTTDARGKPNEAYKFSDGSNIIDVPNDPTLNFQSQITLSCWVKLDAVPAESYVLSHGSYQQRWKISVIPNQKIRWTVKTNSSVVDLDSSFPLQINQFYHIAVVYTGYSMELYINGKMNSYVADAGLISISTNDITFGRETVAVQSYSLYGTLDEVRIYDKALGPNEIKVLPNLWNDVTSIEPGAQAVHVYPNPSSGEITVSGISESVHTVAVIDLAGKSKNIPFSLDALGLLHLHYFEGNTGIFILRIETATQLIYQKIVVLN